MTNKKFIKEIETLEKFFTTHCKDKHSSQIHFIKNINYKNQNYQIEFDLCEECTKLIKYSIQRLIECPHEIKPRCRKCPHPCYAKTQWKMLAKLMQYSGIKLGILKVKKFLRL